MTLLRDDDGDVGLYDYIGYVLCYVPSLIYLWATLGVAFEYNTGNEFLYAGQA